MFQILSPDEVRTVSNAGIAIELHTHRHRTPRNRDLFLKEIKDNRNQIQEMTGQDAVHFCYPSGVHEPEFEPWLREAGVRTATTCDTGLAVPESEWMRLPRVLDVNGMLPVRFETIIAGFLV